MICENKANKTLHNYIKTKDLYRRNVYYVNGHGNFTEKQFKKLFEIK